MEIGPADAVGAVADVKSASVAPCSIDWSWTHNPGLYAWGCLSDDLVACNGEGVSTWRITPPDRLDAAIPFPTCPAPAPNWETVPPEKGGPFLQFVLRLPKEAPGPVYEPALRIHGGTGGTLRIPVTLEPGQYLSTPHECPRLCLYGEDHRVLREVRVRELPALPLRPFALELHTGACAADCRLRLNLRMQRHPTTG
jgi:hypothetical protein